MTKTTTAALGLGLLVVAALSYQWYRESTHARSLFSTCAAEYERRVPNAGTADFKDIKHKTTGPFTVFFGEAQTSAASQHPQRDDILCVVLSTGYATGEVKDGSNFLYKFVVSPR